MAELVIDLYGVRIGQLVGDHDSFDLEVSPEAIRDFGLDSQILSLAIPLAIVPTRKHRMRRQNFFRELLPEGRMLDWLARNARVPTNDVLGLLRQYGRDVAGALQIWDPSTPGEPRTPRLEPLDDSGVAKLLQDIQSYPLANKPGSGKSSLAGVQDKIVLTQTPDGWNRALDGHPSTHILKPASRELPTVIYDEEYGARLAKSIGLAAFDTQIQEFDGAAALVMERYDRSPSAPQGRIHQEDFSQILGASSHEKYQRFGGKVSLARIAKVLVSAIGAGALEQLYRMAILSVAVGNLDMHAKNISVLHAVVGDIALAPAYDFVPQVHQNNDGELAMNIAGAYRHSEITLQHLIEESQSWGLSDTEGTAREVLEAVLETVKSEEPHPGAYPELKADIMRFTNNLLDGKAAGTSRRT